MSTKRSYILKQTWSWKLQVGFSSYVSHFSKLRALKGWNIISEQSVYYVILKKWQLASPKMQTCSISSETGSPAFLEWIFKNFRIMCIIGEKITLILKTCAAYLRQFSNIYNPGDSKSRKYVWSFPHKQQRVAALYSVHV